MKTFSLSYEKIILVNLNCMCYAFEKSEADIRISQALDTPQ